MSQYRLPADFSQLSDPVENPFQEGDPQHAEWANATREAHEEVARIQAGCLQKATTTSDALELLCIEFEGYAALFDAWARRAASVVWSDDDLAAFDSWLVTYANGRIDLVAQFYQSAPCSVPAAEILPRLRNLLAGRVRHWMAEARRRRPVPERQAEGAATPQAAANTLSWGDVKLEFVSEELAQLTVKGKLLPAHNYAEMGFEDRKAKRPNKAWEALLQLAKADGEWKAEFAGRKHFERRIQEIRRLLRQYLERQGYIAPTDDPLPCRKGRYTVEFTIGIRPSFGAE